VLTASFLDDYRPRGLVETRDVERVRALLSAITDPWSREIPLHLTASALIVHPPTQRILLRWHQRQRAWLQVGGHGDPGEDDPLEIALREGREETGLADLQPWPEKTLVHVVVVGVPAKGREPAHEHADLRFILATAAPETARPESADAPLRWLTMPQAGELLVEDNLRETVARARWLFGHPSDRRHV
jgi:8-oxo-dGTP pyrophosphatase MutT (NUDIX family)